MGEGKHRKPQEVPFFFSLPSPLYRLPVICFTSMSLFILLLKALKRINFSRAIDQTASVTVITDSVEDRLRRARDGQPSQPSVPPRVEKPWGDISPEECMLLG